MLEAFCPHSGEQQFSEGLHAIQKGTTQSGRLRFTNKVDERKPKADLHLSVFGRKALGCESPIKSRIACGGQQAETLPWRPIVRVFRAKTISLGRLCESFAPQQLRSGDCASLSRQNHLDGVIARVFRATDFLEGRLCEFFTPQTSRWGDCARFSGHRLSVGVIVRGFQATDFPVGRLREVFRPQTSRWGDCASFSRHRLSGGPIVRGFQATDFPVGRLCESFEPQTSRWSDCARQSFTKKPFRGCDFSVQFTG